MRFSTAVELGGKTATGMQVPDEVVTGLGVGKRPPVRITVGGHTYRTTVAMMGGRYLVPLSAENRAAAQVAAGDEVEVDIVLDDVRARSRSRLTSRSRCRRTTARGPRSGPSRTAIARSGCVGWRRPSGPRPARSVSARR